MSVGQVKARVDRGLAPRYTMSVTTAPAPQPPQDELVARLAVARATAKMAAEVLVAFHGKLTSVEYKGAIDLVTEADRQSEALVVHALAAAFPTDRVIGEEGAAVGAEGAPWCWYVDPLDGTTNYVSGLPHFAVSIGAMWQGVPVLGVILAPGLGQVWYGAQGQGAFTEDFDPCTLADLGRKPRRLLVSQATRLDEVLAATGFPCQRADIMDELLSPLGRALTRCRCVRRLGSASLDLALVAEGVYGLYWERRLKPWDFMAGVPIVREAGGTVTDFHGADDLLFGNIACSNTHLHPALLHQILDDAP